MSKPNNNSSVSNTANSWATTVSRYLLQRREQTHTAYQAQLVKVNGEDNDEAPDWLFEALFAVLAQRLEEGHTVLELTDIDRPSDEKTTLEGSSENNSYSGLFMWQQQLLQPLLQPLLVHVEDTLGQRVDIETLMENQQALWNAAILQSTLSQYEQQIVQQRYEMSTKLYCYLKSMVETGDLQKNSLSKFINNLQKQPLIKEYSPKDENHTEKPIIFQLNEDSQQDDSKEAVNAVTLWLHRTWQAEHALAKHVIRIKSQTITPLPITLNPLLNPEQQEAIHMANRSAFSIITGGPGTGKTFTVAQLVMALYQAQEQDGKDDFAENKANLALAAPTGKAAQRMQESLQNAIQQAGVSMQLPEAKTIHRLLGIGQGGQPRYNQDNPLSEDIIIVDEASMLGVELANYLVSAIKPKARLILLGDANQLAAVDAGAVLADLCRIPTLQEVHQRLEASRRFTAQSGIGKLAKLINQDSSVKNMAEVWQLIHDNEMLDFYHLNQSPDVEIERLSNRHDLEYKIKNSLSSYKFYKTLTQNYNSYIKETNKTLTKIKTTKSIPNDEMIHSFGELITTLNKFRVLTAGHHGRCGDLQINRYLSEQHRSQLKLPLSKSLWYHGRPVMVLQNNYELGLFNGDIGICMQTGAGQLQVFFENKTQGIAVNMLSDDMIATAYAMTIHKSQGSEFEHVAISFDDNNARLLSQELIYTAVTRAKKQVSIFSTESAFTQALMTPTIRQTGLGLQFTELKSMSS